MKKRFTVQRTFQTVEDIDKYKSIFDDLVRKADILYASGLSPCCTMRGAFPLYFKALKLIRRCNKKTIEKYKRVLINACEILSDGVGDISLDKITSYDLMQYIELRLKNVSNETVSAEIRIIKTFIRWCKNEKSLVPFGLELPCLSFQNIIVEKRKKPRAFFLKEFMAIISKIKKHSPYIALPLIAMALTGGRPEAILSVKLRDLKLPKNKKQTGYIKMKALKKGDPPIRYINWGCTMHETALQAIDLFTKTYGFKPRSSHPLFPSARGKSKIRPKGFTSSTFADRLRSVCNKLKIKRFTAYSVRHSMMTRLKDGGVSPTAIRHYAAHKNERTQEIYDATTPISAQPAIDYIEGITNDGFKRILGGVTHE